MVKTKGSLMSLDGTGTLADTVTASSWKGRTYMKRKPNPKQPDSDPQISMREMMAALSTAWFQWSEVQLTSWDETAEALKVSPFNAYIKENLQRWSRFQFPNAELNAAQAGNEPTISIWSADGLPAAARLSFTLTTRRAMKWGFWFRSMSSGDAFAQPNLVATVLVPSNATYVLLDRDLAPGSYFYQLVTVTGNGRFWLQGGERNANVT